MNELERLERMFSTSPQGALYVQELRKLRQETPPETMAVCRAWHGDKFAWPGRSYIWVAREIERARKAVVTVLSFQLRSVLGANTHRVRGASMQSIPFSHFVDFVLTSGIGRLTRAKQLKQESGYPTDFYQPAREVFVHMHSGGHDTHYLDDLLASLQNKRELRIFPKVVNGYKKFLRRGKMTWFEPPMRDYPLGPLSVRVDPELGLFINGRPHAIKLYFRGDPLSPQRALVVNQLLANAFQTTWQGTVFAVLDVRRARLFPYRPKSEVGLLLKAEAASLATLYAGL